MESLSQANSAFALDLYRTVSESSPDTNLFFSPLSVSFALAMVYLGARGTTAEEMDKVMSFSSVSDVHTHFKELISEINSPKSSYILRLANRLYGEKTFNFLPNERRPVQMMYQKTKFPYKYVPEYKLKVLELPYLKDELSMLVLLPDETQVDSDPLQKLEAELTVDKLKDWTQGHMHCHLDINVHLPKFKLEEEYSLKDTLSMMGMSSLFQASAADLTGMSSDGGLFVSSAIHKAFVEVNEKGTEAAAATFVRTELRCLRPEKHFLADHPFLFFIRHNPTKSILFLGRFRGPH